MNRTTKKKFSRKVGSQKGFTLIELMIVVAIIGLLASIAIPQFLNFAFASKRSEARYLLSAVRNGQNAYYSANDHFAAATGNIAAVNNEIGVGNILGGKFYRFDHLTSNPNPTANPRATLDYLAIVFGDIDGDADLVDDQFFVKNEFPAFPTVGNNQVEQFQDDLLDRFLIAP